MSYIPAISIPPGFKEDSKKFTVSSVGETAVAYQLPLENASEYIIKEVRIFFAGTTANDAYFHLNEDSNDSADTRFAEEYYWIASFRMFDSNLNGKLNKTLTSKPYIILSAGTGAAAQDVYGSVRYYYK